ncbi:MAG TPA: DNA polymerase Y family protein, partial [Flavisolibacter sp.]|nr:DNA polymerase Y family protein [Flavisolibacter sp.]
MAKCFVSIWFPYLVTDWHARKQPPLREQAFVLKASLHNRMVVTAANPLAQAQGISPGMVLADAKALCPSLLVLDEKPGLAQQLLDRIAEWCIRFTPISAANYPDGILLDASGCTHLWGGEEAYGSDIVKRLTMRGYTVRAAIADTVGAAWAVARFGTQPVVESNEQEQTLRTLPVSSLRLHTDV